MVDAMFWVLEVLCFFGGVWFVHCLYKVGLFDICVIRSSENKATCKLWVTIETRATWAEAVAMFDWPTVWCCYGLDELGCLFFSCWWLCIAIITKRNNKQTLSNSWNVSWKARASTILVVRFCCWLVFGFAILLWLLFVSNW